MPQELLHAEEPTDLLPEEFLVRTCLPKQREAAQGAREQLLLVGGSDLAALQGVYAFFAREMGVVWLMPGLLHVPRVASQINVMDWTSRPEFAVSQIGLLSSWKEKVEEFRNAYRLSNGAVIPPGATAYFDGLAGETAGDGASREHVLYGTEAGARRLFEEIQAARGTQEGRDNGDSPSVSRPPFCWKTTDAVIWLLAAMTHLKPALSREGQDCNEREESLAAAILDTANKVAALLEGALPGETHLVLILLSPNTLQPPRQLRPHPKVIVQLSTGDTNFAKPLNDRSCPENARFMDALAGWRRLGARVYIYDYLFNGGNPLLPFPSLEALQANILCFLQKGVEGLYFAGMPEAYAGGVDLAALRVFLAARMMHTPDDDLREIRRFFLQGYYGAGADAVENYMTLVRGDLERAGIPLKTDDDCRWLADATLESSLQAFQSVLAQDLPGEIRERVKEAMAGVVHVQQLRKNVAPEKSGEENG